MLLKLNSGFIFRNPLDKIFAVHPKKVISFVTGQDINSFPSLKFKEVINIDHKTPNKDLLLKCSACRVCCLEILDHHQIIILKNLMPFNKHKRKSYSYFIL